MQKCLSVGVKKSGDLRKAYFDVFGTAVGMLCMCRDVTVERLLEKKIIYSANTDQLTDLYNRRYFMNI